MLLVYSYLAGIPQNDIELVQQQNSQEGSQLVYEGGARSRQPFVHSGGGVSGGHSSIAAVSGNPPKQVMVNVNEDGGAPGGYVLMLSPPNLSCFGGV